MPADLSEPPTYLCRACGAAIEVQVGFNGKVIWTLDAGNPDFSGTPPDLRGEYKQPRLVCSADVMHGTGFKLLDGQVVPEPD